MYLLAAGAFAFALYSYVQGDMQNARYATAVVIVLSVARFFFGSQERASVLSRIGFGIQILFFIFIVAFALDLLFDRVSSILPRG